MTAPYSYVSTATFPAHRYGYCFSVDGMYLYAGQLNPDKVIQYALSAPFDLSSLTEHAVSPGLWTGLAYGLTPYFNHEGTRLFVSNYWNNYVKQFDLSTAWDVSTAVAAGQTNVGYSNVYGLAVVNSGSTLYTTHESYIVKYTLSSPWNITTNGAATYITCADINPSEDENNGVTSTFNIVFNLDGTEVYILAFYTHWVYLYSLATPWDLTTATFTAVDFKCEDNGISYTPSGMCFSTDGQLLFVGDDTVLDCFSGAQTVSAFWTNFVGQTETL